MAMMSLWSNLILRGVKYCYFWLMVSLWKKMVYHYEFRSDHQNYKDIHRLYAGELDSHDESGIDLWNDYSDRHLHQYCRNGLKQLLGGEE